MGHKYKKLDATDHHVLKVLCCHLIRTQPIILVAMLEKAMLIAVQAHAYQKDKAGMPYILHPLRVMMKMGNIPEMIVAILHDVIEDSDWTTEQLRAEGFDESVLTAFDLLTKREGEVYEEFIQRTKQNNLSQKVKLADLEDNIDASRLRNITEEDLKRLEKYKRAWKELN